MNNQLHFAQGAQRLGAQQPVRIRNDSQQHDGLRLQSLSSYSSGTSSSGNWWVRTSETSGSSASSTPAVASASNVCPSSSSSSALSEPPRTDPRIPCKSPDCPPLDAPNPRLCPDSTTSPALARPRVRLGTGFALAAFLAGGFPFFDAVAFLTAFFAFSFVTAFFVFFSLFFVSLGWHPRAEFITERPPRAIPAAPVEFPELPTIMQGEIRSQLRVNQLDSKSRKRAVYEQGRIARA